MCKYVNKKSGVAPGAAGRVQHFVGAEYAELAVVFDNFDETHDREQKTIEEAHSKRTSAAPIHVFAGDTVIKLFIHLFTVSGHFRKYE